MANTQFENRQKVLYEGMHFLYHSSTRDDSIIHMDVPSAERRKIFQRHPKYYVDIANTVYFKVPTTDLSPFSVSTNRAAAHLLSQEEE